MSDVSSLTSDGEIDIQPLITKLGHSVEEIRVRALQNIIFKLDHDLLCIGDVVHKKELLIKLLEWFNFDPCSKEKDVLQLLDKLSKHSSGSETLVGIGAVDFLSYLRRDIDPSLYQNIDNVLTNLLSLPVLHDAEQLQYDRSKTNDFDLDIKSTSTKPAPRQPGEDMAHATKERSTPVQKTADEIQIVSAEQEWHADDNMKTATDWRFPWISLADSDRHVLATTNTRLQSNNTSLSKKSCEFLNDVLFKDFPAEIFLQRPSIVRTLLTLLEVHSPEKQNVSTSAVKCLSTLCHHLKHRYLFMTDPQWYSLYPDCWKRWFSNTSVTSSTVASPTSEISDLRTTGDGGEESSVPSRTTSSGYVYDDEADGLVREALELNQMSIDEFCLQVLRGCFPLLQSVADPLLVLQALQQAMNLIEVCYPQQQWWNSHKIKQLRQEICGLAGKTVNYHMLKCGLQPSDEHVEHTSTRHAMTVVNVALWLMGFYGPLGNSDLNDQNIDEELDRALRALLTNEILSITWPGLRTSLRHVLTSDVKFMETYVGALSVKDSLIASVDFLNEVRMKGETNVDSLVLKLDSSLLGLPFHRHGEFMRQAVSLISNIYQRPSRHGETKSKSKNILLSMLSCADVIVRRESYRCCCEVVKKALKHSHVTNPMSKHYTKALFMIDRDVIYVVCAFGMADSDEEVGSFDKVLTVCCTECLESIIRQVSKTATSITETLLDSRLNMDTHVWRKLLDDIVTSLPFLQMYLDKRTKLGICLLGVLAPPGESPCSLTADGEIVPFSQFERLRGWLRCMFFKDKTLRAKNYGYLIHRLVQQDAKTRCEMVYPSGTLENSSELFIIETFAASVRSHRSSKHANFDEDRIRKLFDIAVMETNELSLRKSSAEQLAVLTQDPAWHSALLEDVAEDALVKLLHESLFKDGKIHISSIVNPKLDLVPPCLKILRLLAEYNVRCRHKLAQDASVYDILSRHALLAPARGTVRYEVSCLMTLLLFDEVARSPLPDECQENKGDIMFALPAVVLKRYSLPFNPPVYELYNPYQRETLTEGDPLKSEPMSSMLRVAWNLAWYESPDDVPEVTTETGDGANEELPWTSVDAQFLKSCSVRGAVTEAMKCIIQATSHYAVSLSVNRLSMHFLAENSVKAEQKIEEESRGNLARHVFYSCDWRTVFERYFTMFPKSSDDDQLLGDLLRMFSRVITDSYPVPPPDDFLGWLAHVIMTPESAITSLLHVREENGDSANTESKRLLRKSLLEFLAVFLRRLRGVSKPWLWSGERVYAGDFALSLTVNLNLTDSPQYYDLPVLESTLECLVEMTAISGFSSASKLVDPKELCVDILTSLLQVLTAFNAGRLGAITSFMGRGVTLSVSLCLSHIVHEISAVLKIKDWPSLFPAITADNGNNTDFPWLSPMWTDHLAEVRWCGLVIATHILQQTGSPLSIKQNIAGGLWNLAVIIFMDSRECCLVRDQAAMLFSTLLACLKKNEDDPKYETGLMVQTENEIISGIPALHLLLDHHMFYSSFHQMLRNLVIQNTPRLPGTATFTGSLSTSSTRGIPYQSLDTDSPRSNSRLSTETTSLMSSGSTGDSGKRLLRESPATVSGSSAESSRVSSTIPLLTGSRVASETTVNENRSSTSPVSMESLEILAWVSPRFVGSLSGLLTNLVLVSPETVLHKVKDEDMLGTFASHLDNTYAVSLISQLKASCTMTSQRGYDVTMTSQQRHLEMNLIDTLDMYRQICALMVTCARKNPLISHALQQNSVVLERLLLLFDINCCDLGSCVQKSCHRMWGSVVVLFLSFIKTVKENHLLQIPLEELLLKYWKIFAAAFKDVMLANEAIIRTNFLHLLSHLLLREGHRATAGKEASQKLAHLLDSDDTHGKDTEGIDSVTSLDEEKKLEFTGNGTDLADILYGAYDSDTKKGCCVEEKKFVVLALRNLLCISYEAKDTVIEAGFLVKSLDKIRQLHHQLNMESLEVSKTSGPRKKEMDILNEIVRVLELLKNLVFRSNEAKLKAIAAGVVSVLQQLWSWCTVTKAMCSAVLELLCTLTARCPQASIAMSNTSSGIGSAIRLGPSNNTFVHCVIKMASKCGGKLLNNSTGHGNQASCQIIFSLLKNMAMTSECRGIMWKSNFLGEFSRLKSLSHQKWKAGEKSIIGLWMALLANIAFYRDGQQMIVKLEYLIPLLLEFCNSNSKKINEAAMLVLRNLCFHVPSKTLLLSNSEVVELLLKSVEKPSVYQRALAASALWALLTNNQKAKSILAKPALVVKRLSDAKLSLKPTAHDSVQEAKHRQQYGQAVENILKILAC